MPRWVPYHRGGTCLRGHGSEYGHAPVHVHCTVSALALQQPASHDEGTMQRLLCGVRGQPAPPWQAGYRYRALSCVLSHGVTQLVLLKQLWCTGEYNSKRFPQCRPWVV